MRAESGRDESIAIPKDLPARLAKIGFVKSAATVESFVASAVSLCTDESSEERFADLILTCLASPAPGAVLTNLRRYLESTPGPDVFWGMIGHATPLLDIMITIFASSQYMADIVIRNPGYLYWLMEERTWETKDTTESYKETLRGEVSAFTSTEGKLNAIRRAQRKMLLKIGVRDLHGDATIEETTENLSFLADAIIEVVLEVVAADLEIEAPGGVSTGIRGISVIAMGKHGGGELNYSSDIDLIYASEDTDDETMELYRDLARAHASALSEVTGEGYLYRVDLRLRPDGDVGPLVNSATSMRIYYENRGRPWEFQAMLKARVVAGDRALGEKLLDSIFNLVFSPSLSYSPVEDIGRMRAHIAENIPVRERAFNIKLMAGGIRDIEFAAQTIQLLHGYREPRLRTPNTLQALSQIRDLGHLQDWEVDNLSAAYRFFRLVEHRLQMMHQIKTHTVPESQDEIALLARRVSKGPLGPYTTAEFLDALSKHLNNVRTFSDSFFAGEEIHPYSVLLMLPENDGRADSIIRHHGIEDVEHAMRVLHAMAFGSFPRLYDRGTRAAFEGLLPYLLQDAAETGNPGQTLVNFAKIAEASRSGASFYRLLTESKLIRERIVAIAGFSPYLTKRLCNQIDIVETTLAEPLNAFDGDEGDIPETDRYDAAAAAANDRSASERRDRQRARLDRTRIGGFILDVIGRRLPFWLPLVLNRAIQRLLVDAFDRAIDPEEKVAVFSLGSFAVGEPRLFSDLDLIVVIDGADTVKITKQVQFINQWFTDGNIVKLDFRLRGEGASAPLVQDVAFYENYFAGRMSLWERVAFAKCAHWWGEGAVADKFLDLLHVSVARPFTSSDIASLVKMRKSIEKLAPRTLPAWETKRSPGGRYDIEYITAIGLAKTVQRDDYQFSTNSVERLKILRQHELIDDEDLATLESALGLYSLVEYLMELQELSLPRSREKSHQLEQYLTRANEYLHRSFTGGAAKALLSTKESVRKCFEKFIDKVG